MRNFCGHPTAVTMLLVMCLQPMIREGRLPGIPVFPRHLTTTITSAIITIITVIIVIIILLILIPTAAVAWQALVQALWVSWQ